MLPFPHRSLKTRSFSTPRGRGLCDLPSRSLKGKAGEVEEDTTSGVTGWSPWSESPESVTNPQGFTHMTLHVAKELWVHSLLLRRIKREGELN